MNLNLPATVGYLIAGVILNEALYLLVQGGQTAPETGPYGRPGS